MSNTSLTPELVKLTSELASAFAQCQKVVSAKRIHHISCCHVLGGIPIGWVYVPFANLLGGRMPGEKQNQNRKDVFAEDRHDVSTF